MSVLPIAVDRICAYVLIVRSLKVLLISRLFIWFVWFFFIDISRQNLSGSMCRCGAWVFRAREMERFEEFYTNKCLRKDYFFWVLSLGSSGFWTGKIHIKMSFPKESYGQIHISVYVRKCVHVYMIYPLSFGFAPYHVSHINKIKI